tara:strand:+ start:478 stop:600 length:123 start_codon:yes stop_codon:yes gene_type:complete
MRLTMNLCAKRDCGHRTLAGFRFCMQKNCGKPIDVSKEEE